jgi:hypothetical protein
MAAGFRQLIYYETLERRENETIFACLAHFVVQLLLIGSPRSKTPAHFAHEADHGTGDAEIRVFIGGDLDGLVGGVGGLKTITLMGFENVFDRGGTLQDGHTNGTVIDTGLEPDDGAISFEDPGIAHAVALDADREEFPTAEVVGEVDMSFQIFDGFERSSGGNPADEGDAVGHTLGQADSTGGLAAGAGDISLTDEGIEVLGDCVRRGETKAAGDFAHRWGTAPGMNLIADKPENVSLSFSHGFHKNLQKSLDLYKCIVYSMRHVNKKE